MLEKTGFTAHLKVDSKCHWIHKYALAQKTLSFPGCQLEPVSHCMLRVLCEEARSEHTVFLLHIEVHCLTRGNIWSRVSELPRLGVFLNEEIILLQHITDPNFMVSLAYLAEHFTTQYRNDYSGGQRNGPVPSREVGCLGKSEIWIFQVLFSLIKLFQIHYI